MRDTLLKLLREPLVHFLMIGAGIFLIGALVGSPVETGPERIVITKGQVEQAVTEWSQTRERVPTDQELAGLIDAEIKNEILYREAIAMGLDREDPIVRRRLRQKMELLSAGGPDPYQQIRGKYTVTVELPERFKKTGVAVTPSSGLAVRPGGPGGN